MTCICTLYGQFFCYDLMQVSVRKAALTAAVMLLGGMRTHPPVAHLWVDVVLPLVLSCSASVVAYTVPHPSFWHTPHSSFYHCFMFASL